MTKKKTTKNAPRSQKETKADGWLVNRQRVKLTVNITKVCVLQFISWAARLLKSRKYALNCNDQHPTLP